MSAVPGIGGHLFPGRFLAGRTSHVDAHAQQAWLRWWTGVARACGPATGTRAVFDLIAMPLCARLGFRASRLTPAGDALTARLLTPRGQAVGLHVLSWRGWAARPPAVWRDAVATARAHDADWCLVLAPPHLSLLPARGHASRRSVDFLFPDALDQPALSLLLSLTHASAFERLAAGADRLSTWLADATVFHARLRADLQHGVVDALRALTHVLCRRGTAPPSAFEESLTLVYRVLFLLFAESRALVPAHHPVYRESYTLTTMCEAATDPTTVGLWEALAAITSLSRTGGRVESLEVFPFNGHLFSRQSAPSLETIHRPAAPSRASAARDTAMREALVALGTRRDAAGRVPLHYADLGVEELGAIYERVLDLDPAGLHPPARSDSHPRATRPNRPTVHSTRRKDTGTFYTPQSIADFVVRRTLAPLVQGASADHLLTLRIVDPSMGSGAFLVAALRYLAAAYERAVVDEGRYAPGDITDDHRAHFRRRIAQQCLFGVDTNPVAVQVARLSLWLATLAHSKPLGFLDHRLRVGNSLIGASPDDVMRAPGAKDHVLPLFDGMQDTLTATVRQIARPLAALAAREDQSIDDVRQKEQVWARLSAPDGPAARWQLATSLWTAQWFWPDGRPPAAAERRAAIETIVHGRDQLGGAHAARWIRQAQDAARDHQFFHWPLEFADVFYDADGTPRGNPGFDAVIGNPPWEMVRRDDRSGRRGTGRDPLVRFVRESGLFPRCPRGHLNLYQPFVDRSLQLTRRGGRVGLVVPWGFAVDDGAEWLRRSLIDAGALDTIVGFDNVHGLFPIHRGLRFAVVVACPSGARRDIRACFGVSTSEAVDALPAHGEMDEMDETGKADGGDHQAHAGFPVRLDAETIAIVGGRARRIPDLRDPDALAWMTRLGREHPALGAADGWGAAFSRELNATDDRDVIHERQCRHGDLPVAEGKHIAPFRVDVARCARVIRSEDARQRLPDARFTRPRLVYRDVSGVGNRYALVAAVMPANVVTTHTLFCLRTPVPIEQQHFLCGLFNSWVLNAFVRVLMGGHVTTSLIEQLPVPVWQLTALHRRIARLAARLARPGARPADLSALQAAVARLYGMNLTLK